RAQLFRLLADCHGLLSGAFSTAAAPTDAGDGERAPKYCSARIPPRTPRPAMSAQIAGTTSRKAPAMQTARSQCGIARSTYPCSPAASKAMPTQDRTKRHTILGHSPIISSAGSYTNMNGTMKPAAPILTAAQPVFHRSDLARPEAANTASATGGVIADSTAK